MWKAEYSLELFTYRAETVFSGCWSRFAQGTDQEPHPDPPYQVKSQIKSASLSVSHHLPFSPPPGAPLETKRHLSLKHNSKDLGYEGTVCVCVCVRACAQSHLTLWDPIDCNSPGSSVREISQARLLEWVTISPSRISSQPRDQAHISCTDKWIHYHWLYLGSLPVLNAIYSHI